MRLLLLWLLAACCNAQNSGESLLSRIQEHQNKLRNWEEDNTLLLTTLTKKRKIYDNALHNEEKMLKIVDYLVNKNMDILENVVSELNKIQLNVDSELDGKKTSYDEEVKTPEGGPEKEEQHLAEKETTNVENDIYGGVAEENGTESNKGVGNVESDEDGDKTLNDYANNLFEKLFNTTDKNGDDVEGKENENPNNNEEYNDIEMEYDEPEYWLSHVRK